MSPNLQYVTGEDYTKFVCFCLLKCNYADSQHIQENQDHYTSAPASHTRRLIYRLWREIHRMELGMLRFSKSHVKLNLNRYLLVNNARDVAAMSTQATGNTCYFQVRTQLMYQMVVKLESAPLMASFFSISELISVMSSVLGVSLRPYVQVMQPHLR